MTWLRAAEVGAWLLAACLLVATAFWPGWSVQSARDAARLAAKSTLERVVARERQLLAERGRFVEFGLPGAERNQALAGLDLGQDGSLFDVDSSLDEAGHLHVGLVSRPDRVRHGDVAPVMEQVELDPASIARGH